MANARKCDRFEGVDKMTFKQFTNWCNERACDGLWGMLDALVCIDVCNEIKKHHFWKREKNMERKVS